MHMLWNCPKLFTYWQNVVETINQVYQTQIQTDPKICLLGQLEKEMYTLAIRIPIIRMLFIARKLIAMKWISSS